MADSKNEARSRLRQLRDSLGAEDREQADARIAAEVCVHPAYEQAEVVLTYLSMGTEVDTRAIIRDAWSRGKIVAIPRCVPGHLMDWYRIDDFAGLVTSSFGVEEPAPDATRLELPAGGETPAHAIALVPGFTFDEQGYRVGYGGGFYDRFLAGFTGTSIGLCREAQFSETPVPRDDYDLAVDEVIRG